MPLNIEYATPCAPMLPDEAATMLAIAQLLLLAINGSGPLTLIDMQRSSNERIAREALADVCKSGLIDGDAGLFRLTQKGQAFARVLQRTQVPRVAFLDASGREV